MKMLRVSHNIRKKRWSFISRVTQAYSARTSINNVYLQCQISWKYTGIKFFPPKKVRFKSNWNVIFWPKKKSLTFFFSVYLARSGVFILMKIKQLIFGKILQGNIINYFLAEKKIPYYTVLHAFLPDQVRISHLSGNGYTVNYEVFKSQGMSR